MRRAVLASVLSLAAFSAPAVAGVAPVIGGHVADNGKWPDAVAIMFGNQQGCTGILLARQGDFRLGFATNAGAGNATDGAFTLM